MTEEKEWTDRFLRIARETASFSKDPSTRIGAVAVGGKRQILSSGYNGFPRGINDDPERYQDRATKYRFICHAESNVIYNATYTGVCLDGATLYVYGLPVCERCCLGIAQVGIKQVVMCVDSPNADKWNDSWQFAKQVFDEIGISYNFVPKDDLDRNESVPRLLGQEASQGKLTVPFI